MDDFTLLELPLSDALYSVRFEKPPDLTY
jgi:hypothetical protein